MSDRPRGDTGCLSDPVRNFDQLPDSAQIGIRTVCVITGKSRATIYRWIERGLFPKPRKQGLTTQNAWRVGDIRRALAGARDD